MKNLTYDKHGQSVPSREFLSMVIVLLRTAGQETGQSLLYWLGSLAEDDDKLLRQAVYRILKDNYLDQETPAGEA